MTRNPIDGAPPSTARGSVDEFGSPVGSNPGERTPTLSDALDVYDDEEEFGEDEPPFEIGGVDVGLVLASVSIGTLLALVVAGFVVLLASLI